MADSVKHPQSSCCRHNVKHKVQNITATLRGRDGVPDAAMGGGVLFLLVCSALSVFQED